MKNLIQKAVRLIASEREGGFAYEVAEYALTKLLAELTQTHGLDKAKEIYREAANNAKPDNIAIRWHVDDIVLVAEDNGIPVPADPFAVLKHLQEHHDATTGINWDTISAALEDNP